MKTNKKISFVAIATILSLFSCSKNEEVAVNESANAEQIEQPSALNKQCSFVDNNWSRSAVLSTTIGTATETSFMNTQNSRIASLWGRQAVTLRFVKDASNPNSTFNAISYGTGKIYYGEAIYKAAKARNANNIVNAMILAHEFGHQLQFRFGLPSVDERTARAGELEADGMAGYYLRRPNGFNATSFAAIASAFEFAASIGDNSVNNPNHHGTAAQRRSAVRLGFLLANPSNPSLSATSFDSNFFFYYTGVLNGTYRQAKPEGFSEKMDKMIKLHTEELKKIASGEMSEEEYMNLQ
jgi:uncharacterized protein